MYARLITFVGNKNVQQPTIRVYPSNFFSSVATNRNNKDPNLVDDIKESGSGSGTGTDDRVNVVKTSTTPVSERGGSTSGGDTASYLADTAKQGVAKAIETGLNIGEMAKQALDNVYDVTKDTTHKVKEAVTGEREKESYGGDVRPTDQFVDDLRKRSDGYDLKKN